MFLKSPAWGLLDASVDLPRPCGSEAVPEGDDELWTRWKAAKIEMEKKMIDNTESSEIKKITYVACGHWFKIPPDTELDGPFISGWAMTVDDDPWFASCGKWETVGLLCAVTVVNLGEWITDRSDSSALADTIACSARALDELTEWRHRGNLRDFTDELPEQATPEYFRTTKEVGEILYGVSCLSRATTPTEVCKREFAQVVLSAVQRAERLLETEDLPETLEQFVQQAMVLTVVSVALTYYSCADQLRVLEPPETVGWSDVVLFLEKAVECLKNAGCFGRERRETLETELRDNLNCAIRLDEGFCGEWVDKEDLRPSRMPIPETIPFPF